jgi:hypothetical protein
MATAKKSTTATKASAAEPMLDIFGLATANAGKKETTKKSTVPVVELADTDKEVLAAMTSWIEAKGKESSVKATLTSKGSVIRDKAIELWKSMFSKSKVRPTAIKVQGNIIREAKVNFDPTLAVKYQAAFSNFIATSKEISNEDRQSIMQVQPQAKDNVVVQFISIDQYAKVDTTKAATLKEKYGDDVVTSKKVYSFNPELLTKYQAILGKLIATSPDIAQEDKAKLIQCDIDYSVKAGVIDDIYDLVDAANALVDERNKEVKKTAEKEPYITLEEAIDDFAPTFQLKNS